MISHGAVCAGRILMRSCLEHAQLSTSDWQNMILLDAHDCAPGGHEFQLNMCQVMM
jgi:hypothetical protein